MHVFLQHLGIDQVFAGKIADLLLADKLVLIIHYFTMLLLQLFSDVVNIGDPFRPWTQLRDEIAAYLGLFVGC
jgi:hypothetical protein